MKLYENEKEVNFDLRRAKLIGNGNFGKVYRFADNTCLKIFFSEIKDLEMPVFEFLQKNKLSNFYEVYNFYSGSPVSKYIKGYLMRYYPKIEFDILTEKTDYTLSNLNSIYQNFMTLTEGNICIADIHSGNVICQSDKIIIIDTDLYYTSKYTSKPALRAFNMQGFNYLFRSLYFDSLKMYHQDMNEDDFSAAIYDLFAIEGISDLNRSTKILSKYEYPIDYLKKTKRR